VHVFRFPELVSLINHPNLLWDIDELPLEIRQTSRLSLSDSRREERLAKQEATKELYCSNRLRAKLVFAASSVESDDIFKIDYVLPNAVNVPPFQEKLDSDSKSVKLLFVGNLNKRENIEAVLFIVNDLLPRLPSELKLQVVGRTPKWTFARAALATVWNNPRVEVAFDVENCMLFYTPSTVVLVTLLSGAGTKLKLLEALAQGSPVVATPKATEGLELLNNVHLLIGRGGSEIASQIMLLVSSPELRERLRRNGYEQVTKLYAQNQVNKVIDRCIRTLGTNPINLS
jgi:glycosyltransferase involved in cell wall biosynthesis